MKIDLQRQRLLEKAAQLTGLSNVLWDAIYKTDEYLTLVQIFDTNPSLEAELKGHLANLEKFQELVVSQQTQ